MRTDLEILKFSLDILSKNLGIVETERFIALIQRDNFDYTMEKDFIRKCYW